MFFFSFLNDYYYLKLMENYWKFISELLCIREKRRKNWNFFLFKIDEGDERISFHLMNFVFHVLNRKLIDSFTFKNNTQLFYIIKN